MWSLMAEIALQMQWLKLILRLVVETEIAASNYTY
jgi:hypothetical protein